MSRQHRSELTLCGGYRGMYCNVLFGGVRDGGGREQANETESGGISTVYGVAGRRRRLSRRCSSATRVSLVTAGRNAVGGTATTAVSRY